MHLGDWGARRGCRAFRVWECSGCQAQARETSSAARSANSPCQAVPRKERVCIIIKPALVHARDACHSVDVERREEHAALRGARTVRAHGVATLGCETTVGRGVASAQRPSASRHRRDDDAKGRRARARRVRQSRRACGPFEGAAPRPAARGGRRPRARCGRDDGCAVGRNE